MADFAIKHGPRIWGRELQLFRATWRKTPSDWLDQEHWWSKLSVKILWEPRDLWIGLYWTTDTQWRDSRIVFLCFVPCLPVRIHCRRSYGGAFG